MESPQDLCEDLKRNLGDDLVSVILYGSSAADDRTARYSDHNVLVVAEDLSLRVLKVLQPIVKSWMKSGNRPPVLMTEDHVCQAADVFPIEFMDLQAARRVLYGRDVFEDLKIVSTNLRHELEYELRGKLIQLRSAFMESGGKPALIQDLLARSISSFAVLFRSTLRLLGETPPLKREDVFRALKKHVAIDEEVLRQILSLRDKKRSVAVPPEVLLDKLIDSVDRVIMFVDKF